MDRDNISVPGSSEDSTVSWPDLDGHLLQAFQQHLPSEKDIDVKKIYEVTRTLVLSEAAKAVKIFQRSQKVNPPYWDRRIPMFSALETLIFLKSLDKDAALQDVEYLTVYALINFALERYPVVLECDQYIQRTEPTESNEKQRSMMHSLASLAQERLSFSFFHLDFRARTQKGWQANLSDLKKLYKHKPLSDAGQLDPLQCLKAHVDFDARVYPPSRHLPRCTIAFCPKSMETDLYPLLYVAENMPEALRDTVEVISEASRLPWEKVREALGDFPVLRDMRLKVTDTEKHIGVFLDVYGPDLHGLEGEDEDAALAALDNILLHLLGYYTWFCSLFSVSIEDAEDCPDDTISLEQLPQALQDLGYSLDITREDMEEQLHRAYTGTPSDNAALRADILTGESTCYMLHEEYMDGRTDTADYLINLGVAPFFLALPKSVIPDDEKSFCERLLAHLKAHELTSTCKVIGAASGSQYFYLDLMVWSPLPFISELGTFFAELPGADKVVLHCFRHGAKGMTFKPPDKKQPEASEPPVAKQSGNKNNANGKGKNKKKHKK